MCTYLQATGVMNSLFSVYGKDSLFYLTPLNHNNEKIKIKSKHCNFNIYFESSAADIYDDLISRRVHSSDAEKFAEICPCPCTGVGWGIIWYDSFMLLYKTQNGTH